MPRPVIALALVLAMAADGASGGAAEAGPAGAVGPTPKSLEYAVRVLGIGMTSRVTIEADGIGPVDREPARCAPVRRRDRA